jgi:hypothetical protein
MYLKMTPGLLICMVLTLFCDSRDRRKFDVIGRENEKRCLRKKKSSAVS